MASAATTPTAAEPVVASRAGDVVVFAGNLFDMALVFAFILTHTLFMYANENRVALAVGYWLATTVNLVLGALVVVYVSFRSALLFVLVVVGPIVAATLIKKISRVSAAAVGAEPGARVQRRQE
jgi:hypothetical protein